MTTTNESLEKALALPGATTFSTMDELKALLAAESLRLDVALKLPLTSLTEHEADEIRVRYSGRKSPLQDFLKSLRALPPESRKEAGALINTLKTHVEDRLASFSAAHGQALLDVRLAAEKDDLTLPLPESPLGSRHPISAVTQELLEPLRRMGFSVIDGPELEKDFYNFEALNIPPDHPAREMQDSFFLAAGWVLRTQTSSVQVHAMLERALPLRVVCPGYVYRNEYDMTHVPTFRQMECLVIDKGVHLGHMRHTINSFFEQVFGRAVETRLRSSYFPFTEPSAELDVQCQQCFGGGCRSCKHTGWLEMGGCGLVHRRVLEQCRIDPEVYSGFAFGFGLDRIAMSKYAVSDLRALFDGDAEFLKTFRLV